MKPTTLLLALLASISPALAADWPQWRGANRDDISTETGLQKKWSSNGPKRAWLNEDGGLGYAGFAVVGDKLYTMGLYDAEEKLICLDANTGKKIWDVTVGALYKNGWGNGPRSTPTVAGGKVYAMAGQGDLICADAATGKKIWGTSMTKNHGGKLQNWGYTESPLVDGGLVLVTPGGDKGSILALDAATGDTKWQLSDITENAQYSSILPITHNGQRQYVQLLMSSIIGVSPEGKLLWNSLSGSGCRTISPFRWRPSRIPSACTRGVSKNRSSASRVRSNWLGGGCNASRYRSTPDLLRAEELVVMMVVAAALAVTARPLLLLICTMSMLFSVDPSPFGCSKVRGSLHDDDADKP